MSEKFINKKILVLGANGFVGKNLIQLFHNLNYKNIISPNSKELDLLNSDYTSKYIQNVSPDYIILLAARVGGISANINNPIDFLRENIIIQDNVYQAASQNKVQKILFMGSSCMYPTNCKQPMKEEYLYTGLLEPTNESYALAKLVGLKMAENYYKVKSLISIVPICSNIYGYGDNYDLNNSHVMSALVKKFVDARDDNDDKVEVWGDGNARREFIYVTDVCRAIIYFLEKINIFSYFNLGSGLDISIKELANLIKEKVGFEGKIEFNPRFPNGMKQKLMSNSFLKQNGFECKVNIQEGIDIMIKEYEKKKYKKSL